MKAVVRTIAAKVVCVEQVLSEFQPCSVTTHMKVVRQKAWKIFIPILGGTDPFITQNHETAYGYFGKTISVIINIVDPDVIVIGGGGGNIDLIYSEGRERSRLECFNLRLDTPIVKPRLGDSAGYLGGLFEISFYGGQYIGNAKPMTNWLSWDAKLTTCHNTSSPSTKAQPVHWRNRFHPSDFSTAGWSTIPKNLSA